jgi:hypothetical protein
MTEDWNPMTRKPAAFRPITCLGADDVEYAGLCYSTHRGEIIEPITNKAAEPEIGPIRGWKYDPESADKV